MSIAVSADIKPSRVLFVIMAGACLCVALVASLACLLVPVHLSFAIRSLLGLACLVAAAIALYQVLRSRKTIWLHISATGQIRVVEHLVRGNARARPQAVQAGVAKLLSGTTLWPGMLFLRLRLENGKTRTIPILSDSVSTESFRALSVACRWLISHNTAKTRMLEK